MARTFFAAGAAFFAAAAFTAGFGAATLAAAARSSLEGSGDIPSITLGSRAYG